MLTLSDHITPARWLTPQDADQGRRLILQRMRGGLVSQRRRPARRRGAAVRPVTFAVRSSRA